MIDYNEKKKKKTYE